MAMRKREEKILDVDASMQGNMIFKDAVNLRINGTFEGNLDTKGSLTIGENATVKADIRGEAIKVAGTVIGNIEATKNLMLVPPARVTGNIKTPLLSIGEGSIFDGNAQMTKGAKETARSASANDTLSAEEVANYLDVDTSLILSWAREGKLPGVREKDKWRFERSTLDQWIASEKIR